MRHMVRRLHLVEEVSLAKLVGFESAVVWVSRLVRGRVKCFVDLCRILRIRGSSGILWWEMIVD